MSNSKVLGIIPARGGSKGIPRKNIKSLLGKPLLQYTSEVALASTRLSKTILSTDNDEIAALGEKLGLSVPFLRPTELAQDHTPTLPVLQHAIKFLEARSEFYDAICLLQPTNPLRTTFIIDECIDLFYSKDAEGVFTTLPVPHEYNPHWVYFEEKNGFLKLSTNESDPIARRQELPSAYHREGSVYVTRRDVIMEQNSLYGKKVVGYEMDPAYSVNLDTKQDWERAERLITERLDK